MSLKSPVLVLLGSLVLVVLLSLSLLGCATVETPKPAPAPALAPSPAPAAPAPAVKPSPAPAPGLPQAPPVAGGLKLAVAQPEDNIIIDTDTVEIRGTTGPGAVISANNEFATADNQGNFDITVTLDEGPNLIEVVASDASGNEANLTLTISYVK